MNCDEALAALATAGGWRKSRYSWENGCVEVTTELPGWVGVRDSKLGPASPLLATPTAQWRALLATAADLSF